METRFFPVALETRAAGASGPGPGTLTGYAAVFNQLSEDLGGFKERVAPGAFAAALSARADVYALYNHNASVLPLGRTPDTLRIAEDERGLKVEIDLPDTQFARDLATAVRRGDINQMSFGFSVAEDGQAWEQVTDDAGNRQTVRTIIRVERLFEVSPVVFPAYPDTKVAVRCMRQAHGLPCNEPNALLRVRKKRLGLMEKTINHMG